MVQLQQLGLMPGHQPAVGLVGAVCGEDLGGGLFELSSEPGDPSAALGQRLKVAQQVTPARLALDAIKLAVCAVAVGDQDPVEVLAQPAAWRSRRRACG